MEWSWGRSGWRNVALVVIVVAALGFALLPDSDASPAAFAAPDAVDAAPTPAEVFGAAALERIDFDPVTHLPEWEIAFHAGRDGVRGMTFPDERRIEVYVRADDDVDMVARVLAHEMGHAADVSRLTPNERAEWRTARQQPDTPWWPEGTTYDFDTLAGDFAEAFAVWQTGAESVSRVGEPLDAEDLELVARLVG